MSVFPASAQPVPDSTEYRALLDQYCVGCHNQALVEGTDAPRTALISQLRSVGLALDRLDLATVRQDAAQWEQVVRKLARGSDAARRTTRPDDAAHDAFKAWLETQLDDASASRPDPGRTAPFHRLNRAEYGNAIRDLLALGDRRGRLPAGDDAGFGFDNIGGVLRMSQSLLERYLAAGRSISRLAVGRPPPTPVSETYRAAQDEQQHETCHRLPFGTRGGMLMRHHFPLDANYDIQVQLNGTRGLREVHQLEVTVDGVQVELFTLGPAPRDGEPNPYVTGRWWKYGCRSTPGRARLGWPSIGPRPCWWSR